MKTNSLLVLLLSLLLLNSCNTVAPAQEESDPIQSLLISSILTASLRPAATTTTTTTGSGTGSTTTTTTSTAAPTISSVTSPSGGLPRNIPGASLTIGGSGFVSGSTTVRVNAISATVTSTTTNSVVFTMPEFSSITTDTSVSLEVTANNQTATSTVVYTPLPTLTVNSQFTTTRTFSSTGGNALFYRFNLAATGNVVYNVYGYTGSDLDIRIYRSNDLSNTVASAFNVATDSESGRFNATATGDYVISVQRFSGTATSFLIGVANGVFSGPGRCDNSSGNTSRCVDILQPSTTAQTACTNPSTYSATTACPTASRVGRCIAPFTDAGVGVVNYYSSGTAAFNAGTAQTACNALTNSIWVP